MSSLLETVSGYWRKQITFSVDGSGGNTSQSMYQTI